MLEKQVARAILRQGVTGGLYMSMVEKLRCQKKKSQQKLAFPDKERDVELASLNRIHIFLGIPQGTAGERREARVNVHKTIGPLNDFLLDLHGPTDDIAQTMSKLVPFPSEIGTIPDSELLDLSLRVAVDPCSPDDLAQVSVQARYATGARLGQIELFYLDEFDRAQATTMNEAETDGIEAVLPDRQTFYGVRSSRCRGYRSVRVSVEYGGFDPRQIFERFSSWHSGQAPVPLLSEPTAIEINTFRRGRGPEIVVLYGTCWDSPDMSSAERRVDVDNCINERGWSYVEPREGIMFIRDSMFDAETHIEGDDSSSTVRFVGEFTMSGPQDGF